MVISPKILLMEEPLSSLDQKLSLKLQEEILKLQKELNFTLIHVTYDHHE